MHLTQYNQHPAYRGRTGFIITEPALQYQAQRLLIKELSTFAININPAMEQLLSECTELGIEHPVLGQIAKVIRSRSQKILRAVSWWLANNPASVPKAQRIPAHASHDHVFDVDWASHKVFQWMNSESLIRYLAWHQYCDTAVPDLDASNPAYLEADISDKPGFLGFRSMNDAEARDIHKKRARNLLSLDREIAELIEYLEASGELENTLITFTSDNGCLSTWL